jgi:hypothetical protein
VAIKIDIPFARAIKSQKNAQETFEFFSDLPKAIQAYFPGIEKLNWLNPSTLEWTFQNISYQSFNLAIQFATEVKISPMQSVELLPAKGPYKSSLTGSWRVLPGGSVDFNVVFRIELPVPFLMKPMIDPIAKREISRLFEQYVNHVEQALK